MVSPVDRRGDRGFLLKKEAKFEVNDTQRQDFQCFRALWSSQSSGFTEKLAIKLKLKIDQQRRKKIMNNHSATHLLT